jgi:hypothetical protein
MKYKAAYSIHDASVYLLAAERFAKFQTYIVPLYSPRCQNQIRFIEHRSIRASVNASCGIFAYETVTYPSHFSNKDRSSGTFSRLFITCATTRCRNHVENIGVISTDTAVKSAGH